MSSNTTNWGAKVLRFEVTDMRPSDRVVANSLHKRAVAEREKKETILRSEADREKRNRESDAAFYRQQKEAEAYRFKQQKEGDGDKSRMLAKAEAEKESLTMLNTVLNTMEGRSAVKMRLTEN